MQLRFLGAAGTVTGSRYLVETSAGARVLVDCGLFQGLKRLRLRNRAPFPVAPESIDAVLLTHAHIDHTGYLPALVRDGMAGRVFATGPTRDLAAIMLPDSGHIQEEEARFANRHGFSRHHPAVPLYTRLDAERTVERIEPVAFEVDVPVVPGVSARFRRNGHILGSSSILLEADGVRLAFSGDIGRPEDVLMYAPRTIERADYLVMESTYGGRLHEASDTAAQLAAVVRETAARGGVVIMPAFAVGRAQALMVQLGRLRAAGAIPHVPVFLDSPMARDVSELIARHAVELKIDVAEWKQLTDHITIVNSVEESKAIDRRHGPMIILSASGMASGGRVVHHLKVFASDHRNAILFAGFQAPGTRGQAMVDGARSVRIHGTDIPVRASVHMIDGLSAHADETELLRWLEGFEAPPLHTWVTHGEPVASDTLRRSIQNTLGWTCSVPEHLQQVQLTGASVADRTTPAQHSAST